MTNLVQSATNLITGDPSQATGSIANYRPTDFTTGGLSGTSKDGTFSITRSNQLQETLGGLQSALSDRAQKFANLRKGITDIGTGLKATGAQAIRNQGRRAIGDLRENLARRRVAGSSFAQDAIARGEAEFARQEAEFGAQTDFQVLQAEAELLNQETQAGIESFQTALNQFNLEGQLAASVSSNLSSIAAQNAQMIGQINAEYAAARANIVGTAAGTAGALAVLSDKRLKKDAEVIGQIGPLPLYKFKYLHEEFTRIGFMAQDVEKIYPEAVIDKGIKFIDYSRLLCH